MGVAKGMAVPVRIAARKTSCPRARAWGVILAATASLRWRIQSAMPSRASERLEEGLFGIGVL
jgi:hypothetical protein